MAGSSCSQYFLYVRVCHRVVPVPGFRVAGNVLLPTAYAGGRFRLEAIGSERRETVVRITVELVEVTRQGSWL
jgi:hypothetical protein